MLIEVPNNIIEELIEANILQKSGTIWSAETRWAQVQRLEYHVSEIISAIIWKELQKRRFIKWS